VAYRVLKSGLETMLFKRNGQGKRDVAVGLDLGCSQIKAAVLRRKPATMKVLVGGANPERGDTE